MTLCFQTLQQKLISSQYSPVVNSSTLTNFCYKTQKRNDMEIKEDDIILVYQQLESEQDTWIPIKKEVKRIDKNGEEIATNISYILQFIDSARFMASSLLNLVNNLLMQFIKLNVNTDTMTKNVKLMK